LSHNSSYIIKFYNEHRENDKNAISPLNFAINKNVCIVAFGQ